MQKSIRNLAVVAVALAAVAQAQAANMLTFSNPDVLTSLPSSWSILTDVKLIPVDYTTTTSEPKPSTFYNITTPSTPSAQGKVDFYEDVHSTVNTEHVSYKYDQASYEVSVNSPSQSAGQYIQLKGTVSTTTNTTLGIFLQANGQFTGKDNPAPFGSAVPALPTLGFGTSSLTTNLVTWPGSSFSEYASASVDLVAGVPYSFDAYVYSSSPEVALTNFSLSILGDRYDYAVNLTSETTTTSYLRATVLLAPVPEPENYAMILAGLGLIGAIAKRRKVRQA